MKNIKVLTLAMMMVAVLGVISCGKDDPKPTQRELVLEALAASWAIDASNSSFGNTGLNGSSVTATFTETGFSFGGDITTYSTGGTYTIAENGSFTNVAVNLVPTEIAMDGTPQLTMNSNMSQIIVEFNVAEASSGRVSGLGIYSIVFNKQ